MRDGKPVFLQDVADVATARCRPQRYVWHGVGRARDGGEYPGRDDRRSPRSRARTRSTSPTRVMRARRRCCATPSSRTASRSRRRATTARPPTTRRSKLIQKLLFATASVVALVFLALGRREAAIVGSAVILTLAATLFASWAWGFTLNRVSLFALIFSIGILVDDAIVVVENIHRHQQLHPGKPLARAHSRRGRRGRRPDHPRDADGDRRAAADGLRLRPDGAVHEPDPDQRQHGHADVAGDRLHRHAVAGAALAEAAHRPRTRTARTASTRSSAPLLRPRVPAAARRRAAARATARCSAAGVAALIALSLALPALGLVRAEDAAVRQQVGVPGRRRHARRHAGRAARRRCCTSWAPTWRAMPEVTDYQAYAGTAAPINFNGLVRQYYLRAGGEVGDLQVNLVDKHRAQRAEPRHRARACGPALQAIGRRYGANVKVVEVPPGPPVLAPIVAEIYGPDAAGPARGRQARCARCSSRHAGVVDVDDSSIADGAAQAAAASTGARPRCSACRSAAIVEHAARRRSAGEDVDVRCTTTSQVPACRRRCSCRPSARASSMTLLQLAVRARRRRSSCRSASWSRVERHRARAADLPQGPAAGELRRRRHGRPASTARSTACSRCAARCARSRRRTAARSASTSSASPSDPYRDYAHQVGRRMADHLRDLPRHGRSPTRSGWC